MLSESVVRGPWSVGQTVTVGAIKRLISALVVATVTES